MSEIIEVTFTSACILEVRSCSYKPDYKQWLAQIETSCKGAGQCFYVELPRLGEFLDFLGFDDWNLVAHTNTVHLVEKGKLRIKSIVKLADNELGYERFLINNVFDNGLPFDYPPKKDETKNV